MAARGSARVVTRERRSGDEVSGGRRGRVPALRAQGATLRRPPWPAFYADAMPPLEMSGRMKLTPGASPRNLIR